MEIKELQVKLNDVIKLIKDSNCYIDSNYNVCKNEEKYVISISGIFYNEYMGDSDWRYTEVNGDIAISSEIAQKLIDNIIDVDESTEEQEDQLIEASETLSSIFENYNFDYEKLYCIECSEFYDVIKGNNVVRFHDKCKNNWDISIAICKKNSNAIEKFEVSDEKFGCI